MSLFSNIFRRLRRQKIVRRLTAHDLMEKALKISANNVIIYDIPHQHVIKSLEFDYRWNFDYTGGEPRWGWLHNTSVAEYTEGAAQPLSIVSTLIDETKLHEQQEQEEALSERYKQIFEHSIIGLSFYSPEGWLLDANEQMRAICHFDSDEGDAFFSKMNLFDVFPFNEVLDRNNLTDYWGCSQSIIPERNMSEYLEIRLHPIHDDTGKLVFLAIATRDITEERELYTELRYMMENCQMQAWRISIDRNIIEFYNGLSTVVRSFTLEDMRKIFVNQDDDFVRALDDPYKALDHPLIYVGQMYPRVSQSSTELQWVQINSIPEFDKNGRLLGSFGIWRNINDIMQKQEQLKRETERANDSGHQKSVFLANMTHEIRTPLNAIVGFSDLLQAIDSPEEKREMIRIIHNNCDMLLRLVNDILVLSNVDANAMQMRPEQIDFVAEFNDICKSLAERVQEPTVQFQSESPCETLPVFIDKSRIQQVITNFVTNAVKYTHQGYIRVGYRPVERQGRQGLYVYCEDTGAGIPEDQLGRVFERFVKLNDYIQGTGLGLSICKAIIDKCEGEIGVDSEFGKGSTFWFWIPTSATNL